MTSDMKKDLERDIKLTTSQFTDIVPEIYFRNDSENENALVVFEKRVPDKDTLFNIKSAFKILGKKILLNGLSNCDFASILIVRN